MNGAATNPDCHVVAYAGAQVKKGLDIAKKLGADNFGMTHKCYCISKHPHAPWVLLPHCIIVSSVFWGGREGFLSIHNTDVAAELKHMANFFKMAVSKCEQQKKTLIKAQLGYVAVSCVLFVTRVQREDWAQVSVPDRTQTQGALQAPVWLWYVSSNARFESDSANDAFDVSLFYFVDAMSVIGFLKHYGLESHFKLNIEPNHTTLAGHSYEHDIVMASAWDILTHTTHLWALSWQCTTATWHIAFCGIFAFCKTASACWVQLTQTLALLTWGGTRTSSPWTSGTPPWSWRWALFFHLKCICWQCLWC